MVLIVPVWSYIKGWQGPGEGIQERTLTLRFLGITSIVLRLEVSTIVFCLSTKCIQEHT
jgi:hypothetical protein